MDDNKVHIKIREFDYDADFKDMNCSDGRSRGSNPKPDSQWQFFRILAAAGGEITWENPEARKEFKKWKERLTDVLQDYFSIGDDPFYPYKNDNVKAYKIRMTLIPHSGQEYGPSKTADEFTLDEELRQMNS